MAKNIHIMDYPFLRTQKKEFDSTKNAIFRLKKKKTESLLDWNYNTIYSTIFHVSSEIIIVHYLNTSKVTCCFAIASTVFSYICTLWIPIPQNMANASTKFSSFLVKGRFSNLLTNWNTPNTLLGLLEYIMGMHKMVLCLNPLSISTSGSNLYHFFWKKKKQLKKNS